MKVSKKVGKFAEYVLVRSLIFWLGLIPFLLRAKILERLCLILGKTRGVRRRLETNINNAFADESAEFKANLQRKALENLGRFAAEFIQTQRLNEKFLRKYTGFVDEQAFTEQALTGGVYIVGHLGNWEVFAAIAAYAMKRDMYALIKRQSNMFMDKFIVKTRHRFGMGTVYTDEHPMTTFKLLKRGQSMAFAADQNAGDGGIFIPFFTKFASTYAGPATYCRLAKVPAYFGTCYRDENKKLIYNCEPIALPKIDAKEHPEEWDRQFTANWVRILEEKVRERPEDYFWLHNRWKTQPDDEAALRKIWQQKEEAAPGLEK